MTQRAVERPICELASKIADLVIALGEEPLNKYEGAWTHQVDDRWFIAANGHRKAVRVPDTSDRMGIDLRPFDFAIWYNGWLAGTFNAYGEGVIVDVLVKGKTEDELIKVLVAAIERTSSPEAP
jgi:hypothetical protein